MSDRQQLSQVCAWNRQLVRENSTLRAELHQKDKEVEKLEGDSVGAGVQAEAGECFARCGHDRRASGAPKVSKLIQTVLVGIVALIVLVAAGPTLTAVIHAFVPLVLVVGIIVAVLQLVRYFTRS